MNFVILVLLVITGILLEFFRRSSKKWTCLNAIFGRIPYSNQVLIWSGVVIWSFLIFALAEKFISVPIAVAAIALGGICQVVKMLASEVEWIKNKTSRLPRFNIVCTIITVVCLIIVAGHQALTEFNKKTYSMFITPESIKVSKGYSKKSLLKIVNNNDYPLYQIDLQISVDEGDLSVDDVKLTSKETTKIETKLGSEKNNVTVSWDEIGIQTINQGGKKANHRIIYSIDAHTTKEYLVDINANKVSTESKVGFRIVRTDKNPTDIISFDPFILCQDNNRDFSTYHETSKTMLGQKRYKEALVCCARAISKDPNSGKAYSNMGVALLFLGKVSEAIEKWKYSIELDPKLSKTYLNLAGIYIQQGRYADATKYLESTISLGGPDQIDGYVLMGDCLAFQNDSVGATEMYKTAISMNPDFALAYFRWGVLLKNSGDCESAIIKFKKSTEYEHDFKLDSYGMWGACLESIGKYVDAIDKYQMIINIAPSSDQAKLSTKSIEIVNQKMKDNSKNQ